jgi:hypothetical protein
MRYARAHADEIGDPDYVEVARMLLAEEHRHSRDLGRFMAIHGIPELKRTWTDDVFRRLRNVFGTLEISLAVLVTAEIIAKAYYPALHDATRSKVLRAFCTQTVADEVAHVDMQTQQLASCASAAPLSAAGSLGWLHAILFAGTMIIVGIGHRRVFRASGWGVGGFLRTAWREFARDLDAMQPLQPSPIHDQPSRDSIRRPRSEDPHDVTHSRDSIACRSSSAVARSRPPSGSRPPTCTRSRPTGCPPSSPTAWSRTRSARFRCRSASRSTSG